MLAGAEPRTRLQSEGERMPLRFLTCGSVDDGKSTLIGRLLYDARLIASDHLAALERDSRRYGRTEGGIDFSLLVDGLEAEREQGITIDVAYRFFATDRRSFMVADAPGHEQYTRNMAAGASTADLALVLVDARKGVLQQTKRHSYICALFGIRHVVLAVNKMDLVDFDEEVFDRIVSDYASFADSLDFASIAPIPISARYGDNVTARAERMPWNTGPTLIELLETVDVAGGIAEQPFRFPVQLVSRPNPDFRGFSGTVASGRIQKGGEVIVAGSGRRSKIARLVTADGDLDEAGPGDAVTITLTDEIDVARGDVLVDPRARPEVTNQFASHIVWLGEHPLLPGRSYLMRIGTAWTRATVTAIKHQINVNTFEHLAARTLELNEIAFCNLTTVSPVAVDPYADNRNTGAFILVDRENNRTVAAGMIRFTLRRALNVFTEPSAVDKAARAGQKQQTPRVLWFTGLSGAGKSTIARAIERRMHANGYHVYMLDGDNVRHGLCNDLGFTAADRVENIRRVGEVAKLFVDAGMIVMCAFISPFRAERRLVRELLQDDEFVEIFVDAPLDECMRRDPKGLYSKAKAGLITNFTGLDSPYEAPENPEIRLDTTAASPEQLADQVIAWLCGR